MDTPAARYRPLAAKPSPRSATGTNSFPPGRPWRAGNGQEVNRSAVTNGKRLFVEGDKNSAWTRRFKDVVSEICNDLGGPDLLSEAQRQLIRRAATISIECEKLEGLAVHGGEIDLDTYGMMTDRLGRCFQRLGLKRVARNITPDLRQYLNGKSNGHGDDGGDDG